MLRILRTACHLKIWFNNYKVQVLTFKFGEETVGKEVGRVMMFTIYFAFMMFVSTISQTIISDGNTCLDDVH